MIRRLWFESIRCQRPPTSATLTTLTPWAASALSTFAWVMVPAPSGLSRVWSTYSWLRTSNPFSLPRRPSPSGKKCMPSWCMPICSACSAAVLLASAFQAGPSVRMGSPHGMSTSAT